MRPQEIAATRGFPSSRTRGGTYYFLTPVWGTSYTRLFLDIVVPAQLAPGNLSAFSDNPKNKYFIYTRPDDADTIRSAPVFKKLADTIPVVFELITKSIHAPHDTMSDCFRQGIAAADGSDAALVFLTPDLVFADGSFAKLRRLSNAGYDVIFVPGIRTVKQGVSARLLQERAGNLTISVPPRRLMRIALDNLHPLADSSWWDEGDGDLIPANLYWRVGSEGILGHCFHLHPLLVHPQRSNAKFFGTVDDDFFCAACPDDSKDFIVTDSDDLLAIELSDPGHFFQTGLQKGSVKDAVTWAEQFTNARHRTLFPHPVRMHTGIRDQALWKQVEERANRVVRAINGQLQQTTWRLFVQRSGTFAGRLTRLALDHRLAAANGAQRNPLLRLLSALQTARLPLGRILGRGRQTLLGTPPKPRMWTFAYLLLARLRDDLTPFLRGEKKALLISCVPPERSSLYHLLVAQQIAVDVAVFVTRGERAGFVASENYLPLNDASQRLIIIDRAFPNLAHMRTFKDEAHRVLAPRGQIVILANRIDNIDATEPKLLLGQEAIAKWLAPDFTIAGQRIQGGLGLSVRAIGAGWSRRMLKSRPTSRRLLIVLRLALLPVWVLACLLATAFSLALDWLDDTKSYYVSSLTVATKQPPENQGAS